MLAFSQSNRSSAHRSTRIYLSCSQLQSEPPKRFRAEPASPAPPEPCDLRRLPREAGTSPVVWTAAAVDKPAGPLPLRHERKLAPPRRRKSPVAKAGSAAALDRQNS